MRRNTKLVPLARFRVYGWKSSLYFLVIVWRTKADMLANRRKEGLRGSCDAHCYAYDVIDCANGRARKRPIVGEIHFYKGRLGTEAITHESLHATAALLRRLQFDFGELNDEGMKSPMTGEEVVANVHGKMARSIVERLYDLGFIPV